MTNVFQPIRAAAVRWFKRDGNGQLEADPRDVRSQGGAMSTSTDEATQQENRRADAQAAHAPLDQTRIIEALRTIFDPEIPVNIYDLGLIYKIEITESTGLVRVEMTLTAPGCPVAQTFPATVEAALKGVPGVNDAQVELVWEPPWTRDRMSDAAKLKLGMI